MAVQGGPEYPGITEGLIFCFDPPNPETWKGGDTTLYDLVYNQTITAANMASDSFDNARSNKGYIEFDGTDDEMYMSDALIEADAQNTIDVWINMTSGDIGIVLVYGQDVFNSNSWTWGMAIYGPNTHGFNQDPRNYPTTGLYTEATSNGVWKNFTMVRLDGTDAKVYKNGVLVGTDVGDGTLALYNATDRLRIGRAASTDTDFKLGPIKIYNRSLSATEIRQNYNQLKTRFGL